MKVICSGMSKTGTKTLAQALRILGYKVYDFEEQYFYLGEEFGRLYKQGWTTDDIRKLYDGVDAVTDVPGNFLWEDILKAYPDAKVGYDVTFRCLLSLFSLDNFCRLPTVQQRCADLTF